MRIVRAIATVIVCCRRLAIACSGSGTMTCSPTETAYCRLSLRLLKLRCSGWACPSPGSLRSPPSPRFAGRGKIAASRLFPFHHAHIPFHIPRTQKPECLLVLGRVVARDRCVQTIELDQHDALLHPGFPDLLRYAEREEAAAGPFDRRHGEFGVGGPGVGVLDPAIGDDPIGFRLVAFSRQCSFFS